MPAHAYRVLSWGEFYSHEYENLRKDSKNFVGLAFFGSGIHRATRNLDISQGFAKQEILGKFDYLSTTPIAVCSLKISGSTAIYDSLLYTGT